MRPQLCNTATPADVRRCLINPNWLCEYKWDGERIMTYYRQGQMISFGRKGQLLTPDGIRLALGELCEDDVEFIVDGELVAKTSYVLFDLLMYRPDLDKKPTVTPVTALLHRKSELDAICVGTENPNLFVSPWVVTETQKRAMLDRSMSRGMEGVVFKNLTGFYKSHTPSVGGDWLKHKHINTCDGVVTDIGRDGKQSLTVSLIDMDADPPFVREVCHVKASPNVMNTIGLGDVVEVRYLYGTPNRRLYQPVFLRMRPDKDIKRCTTDQVVFNDMPSRRAVPEAVV